METIYQTLQIIYKIVMQDADPTTFPCTYRDIILNSSQDTSIIQEHLDLLTAEEMLLVKKLDRPVFCITNKGIEKMKNLSFQRNLNTEEYFNWFYKK